MFHICKEDGGRDLVGTITKFSLTILKLWKKTEDGESETSRIVALEGKGRSSKISPDQRIKEGKKKVRLY